MENIKSKNNSVWDMYQVDLKENTIYNIFTKAWNYRWWKKYSENKKVFIISWKVKLISFDWEKDIEKFFKKWDFFEIKSNIPHIFYFEEDSEMIEIFPKNTKTEKFEKYYQIKN